MPYFGCHIFAIAMPFSFHIPLLFYRMLMPYHLCTWLQCLDLLFLALSGERQGKPLTKKARKSSQRKSKETQKQGKEGQGPFWTLFGLFQGSGPEGPGDHCTRLGGSQFSREAERYAMTPFRSGPGKPKKGQFINFSQGHSGTKVQCESCLFF